MKYNLFDKKLLDNLRSDAYSSSRRRAHYNIHSSYSDVIQKVLICLLNDTYIPPHFHKHKYQSELFIVLKGSVKFLVFDENGDCKNILFLGDGFDIFMIKVEFGTIHTVICVSEEAFILEIKQGPFIAEDSKMFPEWSISEDNIEAKIYLEKLKLLV